MSQPRVWGRAIHAGPVSKIDQSRGNRRQPDQRQVKTCGRLGPERAAREARYISILPCGARVDREITTALTGRLQMQHWHGPDRRGC